jgi:hypothetical protein
MHDLHAGGDPIDARIFPRRRHRPGVDVACNNWPVQGLGGGDGKHAGPGADVEHGVRLAPPPDLHDAIEREQTSAGAAVMAGAEGQRRLDLDGNAVDPDAVAVMRPMHHEAAGFDRLETVEAPAYPVRGRQHLEGQISCKGLSCDRSDEVADRGFVRSAAEMQRERPAFIVFARCRDSNHLAVATFGKRILEPSGSDRISDQTRDGGGLIGRVFHGFHFETDTCG